LACRAGGYDGRRANVLVVTTVEGAEAALRTQLAEDDVIKVVTPIVKQGVLDWLANDQRAFSEAEREAARVADELPGEAVEAVAGEADVGLAIRDALATFPADQIVVALRPTDRAGAVETAAAATAPERSVDGIPVRTIVVADESAH
jgi:hypothetical protein